MTSLHTLPILGSTLGALALLGTLTACGSGDAGTAAVHHVKAGDHTCNVDDTALDAGRHAFQIENVGSDVTEVYVYKDGDDFSKIMGEKENIGPGTSQTLQVDLSSGDYQVACKPGMTGDGIRTALTVTGEGGSTEAAEASYDRELEFAVAKDGNVRLPMQSDGTAGERIKFKLYNRSGAEHYLELIGPDGTKLGEAEAHTGEDAEFVSELAKVGNYQVKVYRDGHEDAATTHTLTVAK